MLLADASHEQPMSRNESDIGELPVSDGDIVDAMVHIPGYLDISTEDFRTLYHLAHHNAVERLVGGINARNLLRRAFPSLTPDMTMDVAASIIAGTRYKGLPVVDTENRVVGMLTETDFLRRLNADSFLQLMLRLIADSGDFSHRCHETRVEAVMTTPVITVRVDAYFREILASLRKHRGRSMPVVDHDGRLLGMLLRKDFLSVLDRGTHED
jgi:CBS domain-containing membrane protein